MRYMELLFVLVFVLIGLLNVIFRIAASKRRKQAGPGGASGPERRPSQKTRAYEPETGLSEKTRAYEPEPRKAAVFEEVSADRPSVGVSPGGTQAPETGTPSTLSHAGPHVIMPVKQAEQGSHSAWYPDMSGRAVKSAHAPTVMSGRVGFGGKVYKESAWDKINRLSPLKRAVVMSEILGPPKGQ
jgi:hypothetical protein